MLPSEYLEVVGRVCKQVCGVDSQPFSFTGLNDSMLGDISDTDVFWMWDVALVVPCAALHSVTLTGLTLNPYHQVERGSELCQADETINHL